MRYLFINKQQHLIVELPNEPDHYDLTDRPTYLSPSDQHNPVLNIKYTTYIKKEIMYNSSALRTAIIYVTSDLTITDIETKLKEIQKASKQTPSRSIYFTFRRDHAVQFIRYNTSWKQIGRYEFMNGKEHITISNSIDQVRHSTPNKIYYDYSFESFNVMIREELYHITSCHKTTTELIKDIRD